MDVFSGNNLTISDVTSQPSKYTEVVKSLAEKVDAIDERTQAGSRQPVDGGVAAKSVGGGAA